MPRFPGSSSSLPVLIAATIAALAAPAAHASRARVLVLGTGDAGAALNGGSFTGDDAYNIFYNPAYVNDYKNWAIVEKSNFPGSGAQGGFVASVMNFSFGLYLNRGNAVATDPGIAAGGLARYPSLGGAPANSLMGFSAAPARPIEFFVGGDLGFRWGLGLTWAGAQQPAGNLNYVVGHAGLAFSAFEPFASFKLASSDPVGSPYFYRVGARYRWGEWTPYLAAVTTGSESSNGTARETTLGAGLARAKKLAEGVSLYYSISYWRPMDTGPGGDSTRHLVPIDLVLESDVTSWLTLIGGLNYRLVDRTIGGASVSADDSTTGRFGATFHAGRADFEFVAGKSGGPETLTSPDSQTFDLASGLFTAASLTYRW